MFPDNICFLGQIVSLEAEAGGFEGCILINIFEQKVTFSDDIQSLDNYKLLLAPLYVNKLGFSRGYMPIIGNQPVIKASSKYCYFDVFHKNHVDSKGKTLRKPEGLVGIWGLSNYLVIDDLISEKLGLEKCTY